MEFKCENCGEEFYNPRQVKTLSATMVGISGDETPQNSGQDNKEYIKLIHYAAKMGYAPGWAYHKAIEKNIPVLSYKMGKGIYDRFRKQMGF